MTGKKIKEIISQRYETTIDDYAEGKSGLWLQPLEIYHLRLIWDTYVAAFPLVFTV